jgi:lysophospholipase L1-like esterase
LNAAREPHEEAIFMLKPKEPGRYLMHQDDQAIAEVPIQISIQGLRNEYVPEKTPGEFRILLLGDSFTMGHGLHDDETFAHLLQQKLDRGFPRKKFRVINGGVGGYAPWQERVLLNERGFIHEPDLVILQLFPPNDVEGSTAQTNERLQAFNPDWNQLLRNYKRRNELPFATERWLVRHSRAYERLTKIMDRNGPAYSILSKLRLIPDVSYPSLIPKTERPGLAEVCLRDWYPELYRAWKRYAGDILGIASDCNERGIAIVAFAHSNLHSLYPENWERLNQRWPDTPYEMNKDIRLTHELCETNDIPYVDIHSQMLAHESPKDLFFKHDAHFAPSGARLVADALYNYVTSRHLANP